jgi:hypothetical protein
MIQEVDFNKVARYGDKFVLVSHCFTGQKGITCLTCDGELSRTEVQRRYRELTGAAKELLALDPSVKFYEYE